MDVTAGVGSLDDLSDDELTQRFRALELQMRAAEAELAAITAEVDRRVSWQVDGHRSIKGWLKANANWSNEQDGRRRRMARLVDTIPDAGTALSGGHIGVAQADELARLRANPRCGDRLADDAELLLEHAEQLSYEEFRVCTRRWELLADVDGAHRDRDRNVEQRTALVTELNGAVHVSASGGSALQAAELEAIFQRFVEREFERDVAARTEMYGPDAPAALLPRTDAQRRFDAAVEIFRAADRAGVGSGKPSEVTINVLVDQLSFELSLHHQGLIPEPTDVVEPELRDRRCQTDTGIPLTPIDITQAALHCHVRRVVMNPAGVVTDLGRRQRLFTGGARDAAKLMATRCEHLGCNVSVTATEVDHAAEWVRHNGHTAPDNATNTCRTHNRAKHRLGITVSRSRDGYLVHRRRDGSVIAPVGRRPPPDDEP